MSDNRTFTSSITDVFSYNFKVACNPVQQPFSFTYTNNNTGSSGGTFTMTHLVSVACTNSVVSTATPGQYDQVAITGFGTWSKDHQVGPTEAALPTQPRFMTASISVDPANPYAAIIVFNNYPGENLTLPGSFILTGDTVDVNLSTAENKPASQAHSLIAPCRQAFGLRSCGGLQPAVSLWNRPLPVPLVKTDYGPPHAMGLS